ncbi:MAG: DoxX family protein [Gammaproteobacteria bacterium]|nr:DoxX family protein [Gammaproteobacteria bacterium]
MSAAINHALNFLQRIGLLVPESLIQLLARWSIAYTFWMSGRSKVSGFLDISQSTFFLFEHEYALPLVPHVIAAHMATYAEHLFPILLIVGLFTRFAALSLLLMTTVIQLFVYPEAWDVHMWWAVAALYLIRHGGGVLTLDHLLQR